MKRLRKWRTHKDLILGHGAVPLLDVPVSQFHDQRFTSDFGNGCKDKLEVLKGTGALLQALGQALEKKVEGDYINLGGKKPVPNEDQLSGEAV